MSNLKITLDHHVLGQAASTVQRPSLESMSHTVTSLVEDEAIGKQTYSSKYITM